MITISPICEVPENNYRAVAEITLETMSGWIGLTNDSDARLILIDLRDAVFERAGERLNGKESTE
jgi:hypothetical protein